MAWAAGPPYVFLYNFRLVLDNVSFMLYLIYLSGCVAYFFTGWPTVWPARAHYKSAKPFKSKEKRRKSIEIHENL